MSATKAPIAFPQGGHILGQPFSITNFSIPVNVLMTCNCEPTAPTVLQIVSSAPATCSLCQKTYTVAFNPQNGQLMVAISTPNPKEPS